MSEAAFHPEEWARSRRTRLLRAFLLMSGGVTAAVFVLSLPFLDAAGRLLTAGSTAGFAGLYGLLHIGYPRLAAGLYLGAIWLAVTSAIILSGTLGTPAAAGYLLVALSGALLFGPKGGLVTGIFILTTAAVLAAAEAFGWMQAGPPPPPALSLLVFSSCLLALLAMSVTAARELGLAFASLRQELEEKRRLEDQLRQSQKMEAVGRLAGGIAHDFNNVLMVIMGHGELLRRGLGEDEGRLHALQHMMSASERAARLVRQLLAFGRKQVLAPQPVDLNAFVAETARMLRPLLGEDVTVKTRLDRAVGCALVDPAQIDQVLVNLAVNAREAMPEGGTLSLETAPVPTPPSLSARSEGYLALTVRDTGHGMDEKTRERVFEPFFTTKGESGGSGLGLAMVDGIVRQSGGAVFVESAPGAGSSFQVVLPRALGPAAGVPARAADGTMTMGAETVLVVEDDPAVRALACEMLELHGYATLRAASAEEALRVAERHVGAIHLLLTDVVMPGLGGPALAERFLELRAEAHVLFMSGYAGEDLARRGLSEPIAHLLPKPFTADQLAARVRASLDAG